MEAYLKDIQAWVWHYEENARNYPGFHFTAKEPACEALAVCVQSLLTQGESKRTIPLPRLRLEDEAKITGGQRFFDYWKLVLAHQPGGEAPLAVIAEARTIRFEFTAIGAEALMHIFAEVRAGSGDTCISVLVDPAQADPKRRYDSLWHWPCFGHLWPEPSDQAG